MYRSAVSKGLSATTRKYIRRNSMNNTIIQENTAGAALLYTEFQKETETEKEWYQAKMKNLQDTLFVYRYNLACANISKVTDLCAQAFQDTFTSISNLLPAVSAGTRKELAETGIWGTLEICREYKSEKDVDTLAKVAQLVLSTSSRAKDKHGVH